MVVIAIAICALILIAGIGIHLRNLHVELEARSEEVESLQQQLELERRELHEVERDLHKLTRAVEHCPLSIVITNAKGEME
ncbi:hypothetical protein [Aeoliella mucimassa]|uniref:hypothetical protein n=1 Tax=Aeoliella mucimassa TaxID=2527972 RepID=UPI00119EFCF0|nr:hypothetical protein [Aeoliella mucimassa]